MIRQYAHQCMVYTKYDGGLLARIEKYLLNNHCSRFSTYSVGKDIIHGYSLYSDMQVSCLIESEGETAQVCKDMNQALDIVFELHKIAGLTDRPMCQRGITTLEFRLSFQVQTRKCDLKPISCSANMWI